MPIISRWIATSGVLVLPEHWHKCTHPQASNLPSVRLTLNSALLTIYVRGGSRIYSTTILFWNVAKRTVATTPNRPF